ncbi:MAG: selenocysteine-specific translation elongation factor [Acidimicrobiia bacterium]|nr:selenocysteine-specific translation elongation factor [Acidimicrobiia bacterium]
MPIIGTAGHVDHGKSTLVMALTGRDPDRWKEEKERGLTIDLGFAWTDIGGTEFGFVDVPGHERFIKNMLAGVVAVDINLLVVAADSGWMPQTEEHVRVLDLLGGSTGIIAVTRTDLVDQDTLDLTMLEIAEEVAGTGLESWPVVGVSPVTGGGIEDLRDTISSIAATTSPDVEGMFRMWVDRSFVIHGSGVVVTGTVQRGTLTIDDSVEIQPHGLVTRVRGLHHHDAGVGAVHAGQRAAINLAGVDIAQVNRGTLLATPGTSQATTRVLVAPLHARGYDELPRRGAFHVHSGTADRTTTIRSLSPMVTSLTFTHALPAVVGDRVIIRESGRQAVVAGGTVIDPDPTQDLTRNEINALCAAVMGASDQGAAADALLEARGSSTLEALARSTGGGIPSTPFVVGTTALSASFVESEASQAIEIVKDYHHEHPRRDGIAKAELVSRTGIDVHVLDRLVSYSPDLVESHGVVRLASFSNELSDTDQASWSAVRESLEESFDVARASDLPLDPDIMHSLQRRGDLVRIDADLVFTARQMEELTSRIGELSDGFTVSEFRDHFGMARRQAVPLLEWFDKEGITRRQGNGRLVRNRNAPGCPD